MRNVLKNKAEVFHYWANQVQESGESGNVSFVGGNLYSYARCIATIHGTRGVTGMSPRGGKLVLFGTEGQGSVTTSTHISGARRAASHMTCIEVPECRPRSDEDHQRNLRAIAEDGAQAQLKALKARSNKDTWNGTALECAQNYNAYAAFFHLRNRLAEDDLDALKKEVEKRRKQARKQEIERQKREDIRLAETLAAWRTGAYAGDLWALSQVALRLWDGKVETTKGADIPVKDAIRLWPLIQDCRLGFKTFTPGQPVGVYRLTKIREDGSLVVGCHDIPYTEIEAIAQQLGLN